MRSEQDDLHRSARFAFSLPPKVSTFAVGLCRYRTINRLRKTKQRVIAPAVPIEKMAAEGKCIGHLEDGRVVFVPYAAPGDVADLMITKKKHSHAEGLIDRMIRPSELRVTPPCRHFGLCGGCKWQQVPYAMQLEAKGQQVYDQLTRIGHVTIGEARPILGCEKELRYRNKLEFSFASSRWITQEERDAYAGKMVAERRGLGFHIPGRFDKVLDVTECLLMDPLNDRIRNFVREWCFSHEGYSFFDLRAQEGLMRSMMLRIASTGEVMLLLAFARDDEAKVQPLLEAVRDASPEITSLLYVVNDKPNDTLEGLEVNCFAGRDYILEEMEGLTFRIGPKSFYQTNSRQAYRLYSVVRELAGLTGREVVYDLYTGTGTIAAFLSRSAARVIGIEYVEEAIRDAKANARLNRLDNLDFYAGDMKEVLTDHFIQAHGQPDVIITDPPRAGMHPDVVQTLLRTRPERIVYVSCNPASQARDLQSLEEGYSIAVTQPVDMFPQTQHVESVALLIRK